MWRMQHRQCMRLLLWHKWYSIGLRIMTKQIFLEMESISGNHLDNINRSSNGFEMAPVRVLFLRWGNLVIIWCLCYNRIIVNWQSVT